MTKQVTMKDIAGKLGVSIVTVSKALAGKEGMSDDLRAKIIDKAKELGYQGSSRKNAQKGSGVSVVILVAERYVSEKSFYAKIYQKMVMELSAAGYIGILEIVRRESEEEGILPVSLNKDVASQCVMIGEMRPGYIEKVLGTGVKLVFFDFLNEWCSKHEQIAPIQQFALTDQDYNDFKDFVCNSDFKFESNSGKALESLIKIAQREGLADKAQDEFNALETKLQYDLKNDLDTFRGDLERVIALQIASRYYYQRGAVMQNLKSDKVVDQAVSLLNDMDRYKSILASPLSDN
jgi:hypothetical protein